MSITFTTAQYKLLGAIVDTMNATIDWKDVAEKAGEDDAKKARNKWYPIRDKLTATLGEGDKPNIDLTDGQKTLMGAIVDVMNASIDWKTVAEKNGDSDAKKARNKWYPIRDKLSGVVKEPKAKKGSKKRKASEEATPEAGEEAGDEAPPAKKAKAAPKKKAKSEEVVDEASEETAPAAKKKAAPKKPAAKKGAKKGKKADTPVDDGEQADEPANDNGDAEQQLNSEMAFDSTSVEMETQMVYENGGFNNTSIFNQGEYGLDLA
ncbi:hypothetical protein LTR56_008612 [Elasticomyces elasticus]|nr:hypothetical protein LTR56_008612 [Elasticomyces elasticus]KAK3662218.1 hypothetical protein LTR22_006983 [Elasticomyces elasticus]KAK4916757.1 hypothetical protein LTR49_015325 [Elasticomyces elasticus]KAK5767981.1 hypothetical protein LTS12_001798 [Elasticomyces elasticus]